jgi:8-oxo-dGTP pyrophosphatase MutT (NUDIX family)
LKTKRAVSSGGVVFRKVDGEIQVAVAAREGGKIWCLPKGIVEKDETAEETALREVEEETGLKGEIIDKIDQIDYWFYWKPEDTRYHKFVHFFLIEHRSGDVSNHDFELDEVRWMPIDQALKVLSYKDERQVMGKAKQMIKNFEDGK